MKKLLLLLGVNCLLAGSAQAQTEKGSRYLGANVGNLHYAHDGGNNIITADLYPSAGIFLANNFLLGTGLQLSYYRAVQESNVQTQRVRTIKYGLLPFVRYYVPGTGAHRFFGQAQVGKVWENTFVRQKFIPFGDTQEQTYKQDYAQLSGALGYNYFLTPGAALEVTAGYMRNTNGPERTTGSLDIRAGFAVFLSGRQPIPAPTQ